MPHVVFNIGIQTGGGDFEARKLIPGIEPGMGIRNIFEQRRMKRALLLQDCWAEVQDFTFGGAVDFNAFHIYLKLSQEEGLDPGLLLPIAIIGGELHEADATAQVVVGVPQITEQVFKAHGTVWMPRVVGVRLSERGTMALDVDVHLDYEVVEVPWEQWFIGWDFLDNVVNNERQY